MKLNSTHFMAAILSAIIAIILLTLAYHGVTVFVCEVKSDSQKHYAKLYMSTPDEINQAVGGENDY